MFAEIVNFNYTHFKFLSNFLLNMYFLLWKINNNYFVPQVRCDQQIATICRIWWSVEIRWSGFTGDSDVDTNYSTFPAIPGTGTTL